MLAAITAMDGALVAFQETLLTAEGKKADVKVVRRTMRGPHDWNIHGLVRFGNPRAKKVFICEGVEDALSTRAAGAGYALRLPGSPDCDASTCQTMSRRLSLSATTMPRARRLTMPCGEASSR